MIKIHNRLRWLFFGLFFLMCGAIWFYQAKYVWPKQRCEEHGDWWDDKDGVCAVPIPIWTFTHRMPGEPLPPGTPPPAFPKPKS